MRQTIWPDSSWRSPRNVLRKMLHCGDSCDAWVVQALKYLPVKIMDGLNDKLAFYSTAQRDGLRIAREICQEREIILLSERVFPKEGTSMTDSEARYFIFVVLHEVAHAIMKHRSYEYDQLPVEDDGAQEKDADELAFSWFNAHVEAMNNPDIKPLTYEEIQEAKKKNRDLMKKQNKGSNWVLRLED